MATHIQIDEAQIAGFCRKYHIARLAFFGSVLRDDFRPDSDVDILVEFQPGQHVSLFEISAMEAELTDMLGREVDLRTPADLSPYFRDRVVAQAEVKYAA